MVKAVNVIPADLIHDLHHRVNMADHAQVPLIEILILRIPIVHHLLAPVALDRDSSSSSTPTRRIIPSSRLTRDIPNGRLICASPFMHTAFK